MDYISILGLMKENKTIDWAVGQVQWVKYLLYKTSDPHHPDKGGTAGKMSCIARDSQLLDVDVGKLTGHLKGGAPLHRDLVSATEVESG